MNGLLWGILLHVPMVNILFLILSIVIKESSAQYAISGEKTQVKILKERYARGEITGEEFRAIREDLKNS
jgi:putative membrane protein